MKREENPGKRHWLHVMSKSLATEKRQTNQRDKIKK